MRHCLRWSGILSTPLTTDSGLIWDQTFDAGYYAGGLFQTRDIHLLSIVSGTPTDTGTEYIIQLGIHGGSQFNTDGSHGNVIKLYLSWALINLETENPSPTIINPYYYPLSTSANLQGTYWKYKNNTLISNDGTMLLTNDAIIVLTNNQAASDCNSPNNQWYFAVDDTGAGN